MTDKNLEQGTVSVSKPIQDPHHALFEGGFGMNRTRLIAVLLSMVRLGASFESWTVTRGHWKLLLDKRTL